MGLLAAVSLAAFPAGALATPAPSTTIAVNDSSTDAPLSSEGKANGACESTDATHGCTLRAAVELADEREPAEVTIDVPAGTFTNTAANGGALEIVRAADVKIVGAGATETILDGGGAGVGSVISADFEAKLSVEGVTIRDGSTTGYGGGIDTRAISTTVKASTITANTATLDGGGIYARGGFSGLTIERSTIAGNTAGRNGGGVFEAVAVGPIVNSTIADNHAGEHGGGLYDETSQSVIVADTFADNTAGLGTGQNITSENDGTVWLRQTIIAAPASAGGPGCEGIVESLGYNIDDPTGINQLTSEEACGLREEAHDLIGIDPRLDPSGLKANGGPTETVALLGPTSGSASPAIDAVPAAACVLDLQPPVRRVSAAGSFKTEPLTTDQRGSPRPDPDASETNCDIGAYEFSPTTVTPTCTTPPTVAPGQQVTIVCTIEKGDGMFATGTTATFTLPEGSKLDSITPSQGTCSGAECALGTIDPATITLVLSPLSAGTVGLTASDIETGAKSTSTPVSVAKPTVALGPGAIAIAPAPKQCASLRHFRVHIQNIKVLKIVSATVYVGGKRKRVLRGRALSTIVDLRGLPKETFTVRIVARTRTGKRLTGKRTYHTCVAKLPGHKRLYL